MTPVAKKYFLSVIFNRIKQGDDPEQYKPFLKRWVKKDFKPLPYELAELLSILNNRYSHESL